MIARIWTGTTPVGAADDYVAHLRTNVLPELERLAGHLGAYVLRRASGGAVAFTVVTLWQSVDAVRAFAGDDVEAAVVPPEAQALLSSFDDRAVHWEVALAALDKAALPGAK
jgi:heme-degrading monooxygenase HmoA